MQGTDMEVEIFYSFIQLEASGISAQTEGG